MQRNRIMANTYRFRFSKPFFRFEISKGCTCSGSSLPIRTISNFPAGGKLDWFLDIDLVQIAHNVLAEALTILSRRRKKVYTDMNTEIPYANKNVIFCLRLKVGDISSTCHPIFVLSRAFREEMRIRFQTIRFRVV